ncbi:exodeoxyribonuclease VII large subunit [bacterium]|nr:exodeoxyribonuclease VII large subunit [bacterium]
MQENLLFAQTSISPYIYTVSEITSQIKTLLSESFPFLWIKGEVSNITTSKAGHTYFTLKDTDSQISCVLFGRVRLKIPILPQSGEEVAVGGFITVYEKSGGYQIVVEDILFLSKKGKFYLAFEKLKEKLKKEGFFDPIHKKPIPALVDRVAVVTSPTGAAIQDILKHLPDIEILIFGVSVQGEGSAREIASAIERIHRLKDRPDVIIVGRGGGSIEDLWSFNEEITARAIFSSEIVVISAVGHETDVTISDMVADYRAPTPTAAGEIIRKLREEAVSNLKDLSGRLRRQLEHLTKREGIRLKSLTGSLVFTRPYLLTLKWQQRLDDLYLSSERATKVIASRNSERFRGLSEVYKRVESKVIDSQKERLVVFEFELSARIDKIISRARVRLASVVFTRPYFITFKWQQRLDDLYLSSERATKVIASRNSERFRGLSEVYKRVESKVIDSQKERLVVFEFELSARIDKIIAKQKVILASLSIISSLDPKAPLKRGYSITYKSNGSIVRRAEDIKEKEGLEIKLGQGRIEVEVTKMEIENGKQ